MMLNRPRFNRERVVWGAAGVWMVFLGADDNTLSMYSQCNSLVGWVSGFIQCGNQVPWLPHRPTVVQSHDATLRTIRAETKKKLERETNTTIEIPRQGSTSEKVNVVPMTAEWLTPPQIVVRGATAENVDTCRTRILVA